MVALIDNLRADEPEAWLSLFVIYWTLMCAYGLIYCMRINRWSSVFGELLRIEVGPMSPSFNTSDQNYSAELSYSFVVDGTEYKGHRLSPFYVFVSYNLRFLLNLQMKHIEIREDGKRCAQHVRVSA